MSVNRAHAQQVGSDCHHVLPIPEPHARVRPRGHALESERARGHLYGRKILINSMEALPLSKTSTSVWDHIIRRSIMVLRVKHHTVDLSFQQPFNFVITTTVPRGVC